MDEVVLRRVVGVITLAIAAFLLSWLLPRPGLDRLRGEGERVVTVDLTRPDAVPQEIPPPSEAPSTRPSPPRAPDAAPTPEAEIEAAVAPSPIPEPVQAPKPVETPKPVKAQKPVEVQKVVEAPKPVEKPAAAPKPAEPKPVETKPVETKPKASTAPSSGGSGTVLIQAGAYSHLDKAEQVRAKAGAQGQHCTISPAETAKGTLYRVRCGPYADRVQAQAAIKALGAAGITAQLVGGAR